MILKLQTDLDTTQEKYTGCVEEVITQNTWNLQSLILYKVLGNCEFELILIWFVAEYKRGRGHKVK